MTDHEQRNEGTSLDLIETMIREPLPAGTSTESVAMDSTIRIYQIELESQNAELRRTQLDAETSRALYFDLYDNAPLGFCTLGPDGEVRRVNMRTAAMLNLPVGDIIGRPFINFILMVDLPLHNELGKALQNSETHRCELRMKVAGRAPLWVELTAERRLTTTGEKEVQIAIGDIHSRKSLEEQLRQAQKMEAFGQMAGGIAHDFNNILATILMQAELMEMHESLPIGISAGLERIRSDAMRAAGLTRQLLLFSQKHSPTFKLIELNEVVANFMRLSDRIVGDQIRISTCHEPGSLVVLADVGMLDQVMMNLVRNSVEAMPQGGEIRVRTGSSCLTAEDAALHPNGRPGLFAMLSFEDFGCGMTPEVRSRIFEPFFTTKDVGKGTGLGLATVHGIVKEHNGFMSVETEPGRGTRFRIFLPVADGQPQVPEELLHEGEALGGTETILLVEDSASLRELTSAILERSGYEVLPVINALDALHVWKTHPGKIDLLLTDVQIPGGMDGINLADQMILENSKLAVILISACLNRHDGSEIRTSERRCFLQKPVDPDNLLRTIRLSLT